LNDFYFKFERMFAIWFYFHGYWLQKGVYFYGVRSISYQKHKTWGM